MMVAETVEPEKSSSIPGMPVAEVRRHLAAMRRDWEAAARDRQRPPAYLTTELAGSRCLVDFSLLFVMSHHAKRRSTPETAA